MDRNSPEHKIQFLENRMINLVKVFNKLTAKDYPWSAMVLDFGYIVVMNQQEMAGRIKELSDIVEVGIELYPIQKENKMIPHIEVRK